MPLFEYKIVAGWNGTPANMEGISVSGATALDGIASVLDAGTHYVVRSIGQYNINYQFTAGGITQNGYAVQRWTFPVISTKALEYLIANYAQGSSQGGKVTIGTRLLDEDYVEKNAFFYMPYPNVMAKKVRDSLWVFDEGVVTGELRIVGDTA